MSEMADVLRNHWILQDVWPPRCFTCGDVTERTEAEHKAAALTAAGFGPAEEPVVIHVHHDMEAHARSFNEGYEAAVTQGLADDPSLADDWFQDKMRKARAGALEAAADAIEEDPYDALDPYYADWLRDRARNIKEAE